MTRKVIFLLSIVLIAACGKNRSSIIPLTDMKVIVWDMLNADSWSAQTAMRDTTGKLSKQNVLWYQQIFRQHDITKEQFYKSYGYYESHPDKMKILIDSVEAYGTRTKFALDYLPVKQLPRK
jgi:hypothetical protein